MLGLREPAIYGTRTYADLLAFIERAAQEAGSTAASKAAELRKMFKIDYFNSEWLLPELIEDNPAVWMVMVNGFIVDIRDMPLELQRHAFEKGIIPYVPGEKEA
jgi:hypothetical protein